jgi:hypothetical protein
MEPYLFSGIVLPERALLNFTFGLRFQHLESGVEADARVSIIWNQVAVWVHTDREWDIYDLRNVVINIVHHQLCMVGFLLGRAYEFSITRVVNLSHGIDYVFGIDTPCVARNPDEIDLPRELQELRDKSVGQSGIYLNRCFSDLVSALKHFDDTAFYCYRAIESLRHHVAVTHNATDKEKAQQWQLFRSFAGVEETAIKKIKVQADGPRHGNPTSPSANDRGKLLQTTWDIVRAYVDKLQTKPNADSTSSTDKG